MRLHPPTAAIAVSLTAVLLAACGDADETTSAGQEQPTATAPDSTPTPPTAPTTDRPATPTPTATASPDEVAFATCESDEYTIDHPAAWETNEGDVIEPCRVFHPGDIDLEPQQDRSLHYAVSIYIDPVSFERASDPSGPNEVLSHEEVTVAGRDAVAVEQRSSGDALVPEGERWYSYVVDLGDERILVAATHSVGETDYEEDKRTLDRMMETLELTQS